jgi:hypothetical protein
MGKGGMGGGGMGSGGKALDAPCSQIMVRTALDGPREWTILEMQVRYYQSLLMRCISEVVQPAQLVDH